MPRGRSLADLDRDRNIISSRSEGSLSQFVAAKGAPTALRNDPPTLATGSLPPDLENISVQSGQGATRDADVSKAAQAREAIKDAAAKKKIDPRILAIDPSERHLLPALAIQSGMAEARKLMWKHMDPNARSRYVMRKAVPPSQG